MPLRLTFLERVLVRFNLLPVPLLDTLLSVGIAKVLLMACELKLFDTLSEGPLALDALAERLQCSQQGLLLLLQVLVPSGYLREKKGHYGNSAVAQRWLCGDSALNIAPNVIHSTDIADIWDALPQVVCDGRPAVRMPYEDTSGPEMVARLERHYLGLASLGLALGGEVVARIRVPDHAKRLLDVGGSHAAYSVLFCRKHPRLQATVVDLHAGIEVGKRIAMQANLKHRISFVDADIVSSDFPAALPDSGEYDIALYFHVAHLLSAEVNAEVLTRVARTLRPGGILVFVDQVIGQAHRSRLASLLIQFMALTMATIGGSCYPFATVKGWLEQTGMGHIQQHRLLTPGATLITARKL
jgi:SAM-dependent methyltransferase